MVKGISTFKLDGVHGVALDNITFVQMQGPRAGTVMLRNQVGVELAYFITKKDKDLKSLTYNWMTIGSDSNQTDKMQYGTREISFTSRQTCHTVTFAKNMTVVPTVLLTLMAHHNSHPDLLQSSHAWLTNVMSMPPSSLSVSMKVCSSVELIRLLLTG
jgi:hypothetical protein